MKLPFTTRQFLDVFKSYNEAVWPFQLFIFLLAAIIVFYLLWRPVIFGKFIPLFLAFLWIWMGAVYHMVFFSVINRAANIFGLLFIVQGLIFLRWGIMRTRSFEIKRNAPGITAISLIVYALAVYPVIGYYGGHAYPYSPTFGLPCPTAIFTFGILIAAKQRVPFYMLIIPVAWAVVGLSAVLNLGMYEDIMLTISAMLCCAFLATRYRRNSLFRDIISEKKLKTSP